MSILKKKPPMKSGPEKDSGKPSLAIAFNMQSKKKKKMMMDPEHEHDEQCMSEGGMCKMDQGGIAQAPDKEMGYPSQSHDLDSELYMQEHKPMSMAEEIMMKHRAKKMADGGMVDIQENGEEDGSSPYDDMNEEAAMKELYDDAQLSPQPEDSNEHGHDLSDEDAHDMVSMIRKKLKMKMSK